MSRIGVPRLLAFLLVALSLLVVLAPERGKVPLVAPDGFVLSADGFVATTGDARELPASLGQHADTRYWSTWTPEGTRRGTVATTPFTLPRRGFALPVRGFPGIEGNAIEVECVATGERRRFAEARTNSEWGIAAFRPGRAWCDGDRQVVLHVSATSDHYLSIGSPFAVSGSYRLKTSAVHAGACAVLAWAMLAGLFWLLVQALGVTRDARIAAMAALAAMGVLGYAAFFVFFASVTAGGVFTVALAAAGAIGLLRFLSPARASTVDENLLRSAVWLWLVVALLVIAVFAVAEVNAGPWSPNSRFLPAGWSSDNQLPMRIGQMVASGHLADTAWMGPWHVSDRPPLAYGVHAVFTKLFASSFVPADGVYLLHQHSWPVGVLLNTAWAPLLFLFLRRGGASTRLALALLAGALLSPFLLFNSGYIWPKLLAGTFGFAAAWLLFDTGTSPRRPLREDSAAFLLAAVLSALALQAHGGAVFGVLAMLLVTPFLRGLPRPRDMLLAAVAVAAVLVPWMLFQRLVDPPGNALLKYAFAGTFGFGEEDMGVLDTIRRTYAGFTATGWLQSKWNALVVLAVGGGQCGIGEQGVPASTFGLWRIRDFLFVLPSLCLLAGAALVARVLPRSASAAPLPAAGVWLGWGLLSVALAALLTLDCNINHTQSYQALLALHLGLLLVMARQRLVLGVGLAVVAAYGVGVWILDPLRLFAQWDGSALVVGLAALAVLPMVLRAPVPPDAR